MTDQPWMKFYPRDWRADQALRVSSLAARGLWMEMLCVMHEASPYGHLLVAGQPVGNAVLARLVGATVEEVEALLLELQGAGVFRLTRQGVVYSKRMTDDHKRAVKGRKDKLEALEKSKGNPSPSRGNASPPTTQKAEGRAKSKGPNSPLDLSVPKNEFSGPKEVRDAFLAKMDDHWVRAYIDPCAWQDVPERGLIPATHFAAGKITREAARVLAALGLSVLDRAA